MKIHYKATLTIGIIALTLTVILAFGFGRYIHVMSIDGILQNSLALAEEIAGHFESDIILRCSNAESVSSAPVIYRQLLKSNKQFSSLTEFQRAQKLEHLNSEWMESESDTVAFIRSFLNNPAAQFLKRQQELQPGEYGEIFLTNRYGALVASTGRVTTFSHAHKYWWEACYNNGEGRVFLDDRGYDASVGGYVMGIVVPIIDSGEIIGILKSNINIEGSLTNLTREYKTRKKGKLQVVRTSGQIVADDSLSPLTTTVEPHILPLLKKDSAVSTIIPHHPNLQGVVSIPIPITRGSTEYGFGGKRESIDHILGNSGDAWHMVLYLRDEFDVIKEATRDMIVILSLFAAAVTIISLLVSKIFTRPIIQLAEHVQQFGEGELTTRISLHTRDEIETLAHSFNAMAENISNSNSVQQEYIESLHKEINSREKIEKELLESEQKFRNLFEQSPIGLALCDMEGTLVSVNSRYADMIGYTIEETLQLTYWDITPSKYKESEEKMLNQLHREKRYGPYEKEYRHKEGHLIDVRLNGMIVNQGGEEYIWSSVEDISILKKAEREKEQLYAQLEQAHKMEAIGTLAGGIAHDFNNILSAVLGFVDLALHEDPQSPEHQEHLENIEAAGVRARELVHQILAFSRKAETVKKPVTPALIIQDVVKLLRATTPANISIIFLHSENREKILGDLTQIHQLLLNLCTNGIQAIGTANGTLTITLTQANHFSGELSETFLCITISDTGIGIPEEHIQRIFDPYFTTKTVGDGAGMGLAVVSGIVKSHNGTIEVESTPGEGTQFRVCLPIIRVKEESQNPPKISTLQSGGELILVVDDEPSLVLITTRQLERRGYIVEGFTSSIDALDAFRKSPERYDLVITDYTMPEINGEKLAAEMRKIRTDTPIIICTGYSEQFNEETAQTQGINRFMMKPINYKTLLENIQECLRE